MKDKSVWIIIAVAVVGVIALSTGFKQVPLSENPWVKSGKFSFGREYAPESPSAPESPNAHRTIEASGATSAKVTLEQGVGEMFVKGEAGPYLMDARFDTSPEAWMPNVDYSVEGTTGVLSVTQPELNSPMFGDNRNTWNVSLSQTMPIDLRVNRGVGEGTIDLSAVDVTSVRGTLGVGETTFDLSGARPHDVSVDLQGGIGQLTLILPNDMAVRVVAEKGIGEINTESFRSIGSDTWVNELDGKGGPTMTIRVTQGIGEVRIETAP